MNIPQSDRLNLTIQRLFDTRSAHHGTLGGYSRTLAALQNIIAVECDAATGDRIIAALHDRINEPQQSTVNSLTTNRR